MQTAQFADSQFVNAASMTAAANQPKASLQAHGEYLHTPGLAGAAAVTFAYSGLVVTASLGNTQFLFGDGTQCAAYGNADGVTSSTYAVDFSGVVPATGAVTAYLVASKGTVQQGAFQVVGPPNGHPDYDPSFAPYTAYSEILDTVILSATTTPPDNVTTMELGRVTLNGGQSTLSALDTSHQRALSAVLDPVIPAGTANYPVSITVRADGRVTSVTGGVPSVQDGTGIGQVGSPTHITKIGWDGTSKLKGTVDTTNLGNFAFEAWVASNFSPLPLTPTGVAAKTYLNPSSVTVALDGRVTAISAGANGLFLGSSGYYQPGTFTVTPPAGATSCVIRMLGGGGGGGGCDPNGDGVTGHFVSGAGGGAGAYVEHRFAVSGPFQVTVGGGGVGGNGPYPGGDGGDSTVPSISLEAGGGRGGEWSGGGVFAAGGAGGVPYNWNLYGSQGSFGSDGQAGAFIFAGNGGSSTLGGAGRAGNNSGVSATGYGSGGGGVYSQTTAAFQAGNGGSGMAVLDWYS